MPARSPAALGLLNNFMKAGTCDVSRPIIPARIVSAARAWMHKVRNAAVRVARNQRLRPVKGLGCFIGWLTDRRSDSVQSSESLAHKLCGGALRKALVARAKAQITTTNTRANRIPYSVFDGYGTHRLVTRRMIAASVDRPINAPIPASG